MATCWVSEGTYAAVPSVVEAVARNLALVLLVHLLELGVHRFLALSKALHVAFERRDKHIAKLRRICLLLYLVLLIDLEEEREEHVVERRAVRAILVAALRTARNQARKLALVEARALAARAAHEPRELGGQVGVRALLRLELRPFDLAHFALFVDITLLPFDKRIFVHVRVHLNVRVVGQLEVVPLGVVQLAHGGALASLHTYHVDDGPDVIQRSMGHAPQVVGPATEWDASWRACDSFGGLRM